MPNILLCVISILVCEITLILVDGRLCSRKTLNLLLSPLEIKNDPVEFGRKFLRNVDGSPFEPHDGQIELLRNIRSTTTACCGRQWGKSVSMAVYVVWYMVTHPNRQVYIIAPTLDQSKIIFNEVARHFRSGPLSVLVEGKIIETSSPRISLSNGTQCHGRGANSPAYIRGKPAHLIILDEAAFFKAGVIPNVIEPMLTVTGKMLHSGLIMISTPFGRGDFYDCCEAARKTEDSTMNFFRYASETNPHVDRKRLEAIKKCYGEQSLIWLTEYMAQFVDSDLAVFKWEDIKAAYEAFPGYSNNDGASVRFPLPAEENRKYVQGVDLANVRDYFVSTVLDITRRDSLILSRMDRLQKRGYSAYTHETLMYDYTTPRGQRVWVT